jgi:hypothetical protein
MMDQEECESIRRWVREGGKLIATGGSSLVNKSGQQQQDFMLTDVLGVSLVEADWSPRIHYIAPTDLGLEILPDFDLNYPAMCGGQGFSVKAHDGTEILATTTLPWPRTDGSRFASIHSDPPWIATDQPEITRHSFGKGQAIYCASLIENMENAKSALVNLVRDLKDAFQLEVDAPQSVEATLFRQPDRKRYVLSLLNFQKEMPNIPVQGIRCRMNVIEPIRSVNQLVANRAIQFEKTETGIAFETPRLETLLQFEAVWS